MVYYTTNGTCPSTDSVSITINVCTGIDVNENELTNIYPNPTIGLFTIKLNNYKNVSLTITDAIGKEIMNKLITSNITEVDLQGFKSGIYFVKLQGDNLYSTQKIILE